MPLIVRCPLCKGNKEYEEDDLHVSSLLCPNCNNVSRIEDYSVMTFCPNCHQKLAIPANMINVEEIYCAKCDYPFKPNASFSLEKGTVETELTNYHSKKEKRQIYKCGEYFEKYEIISLLGRGGMGEVYLAKHLLLNKTVALKIMRAQAAAKNPVTAKRFIREAKLANKIKSPNIIDVYDVGIEQKNNNLFIAMEYVDGLNLHEILHLRGKFSEYETLHIAHELCNALLIMEENKIVHRDIKPSNIMLNSKKEVKLADLGIAKVDSSTFEGELTLTQDNLVFGTPDYASPEQCRSSHNTDSRSDIYSLGATMFYMVTGVPPFRGENAMDTIVKVINEPLPDILQLEPNISSDFKQLINDMMAKSPTNRPQTITELQTRIFQVIESIQSNDSIDTTLSNNSLKTLSSFLHKIDRLSLIKNWNLNETETMSNTGVNLLTKFCKITGIAILILGFLSFICIVTGIKIDKRIAAIFQKQKNNITNSLPIQKIAYTSKNALAKFKRSSKLPKTIVIEDKGKVSDSEKSTLTIEEFTKLYNKLFFTNPELSHLNSFNSIENRLNRTNKILANEKLNQYKNSDIRFKEIYNFYTQLKTTLTSQIKYCQTKDSAIKSTRYSTFATNEIKAAINNYFLHCAQKDNRRAIIEFNNIKELFENKNINLDFEITIPKEIKYDFYYTQIYPTKEEEDLTLPLAAIVYDRNSNKYQLCKYLKKPLKSRYFTIPLQQSIDYSLLAPLGINSFNDVLLKYSAIDESNNNTPLILIQNGDSVNQGDFEGNTILHNLTRNSNIKAIKAALIAGCEINKVNKDGETPLFIAERYGNKEIRDLLLLFGADSTLINNEGKTANAYRYIGEFNTAIKQFNYGKIKLLLKKYPHLTDEFLWNKYTPSQHAIATKQPKMLKILFQHNVNLEKFHPDRKVTTLQELYLHLYPKTLKALDKEKLQEITKLVTKQNIDLFSTTNVRGGKLLLVELNSSLKKSYFAENLLRSLATKFDSNKDLPILLDKLTQPYKKIVSPFLTIEDNYQAKDFEVLNVLLEQNAWIKNNNPAIKELMPEILGRLKIDVNCLTILSRYGFDFKVKDSKGKNTLDYFISAFAQEINCNENKAARVNEFLTSPNLEAKYKKHQEKYLYLLSRNLRANF